MEIEKIAIDVSDKEARQADINRREVARNKELAFEREKRQKLKNIQTILATGKPYNYNNEEEKADLEKYGIYREVVAMVMEAGIKAQFALDLNKQIGIDDEEFISEAGFGIM